MLLNSTQSKCFLKPKIRLDIALIRETKFLPRIQLSINYVVFLSIGNKKSAIFLTFVEWYNSLICDIIYL